MARERARVAKGLSLAAAGSLPACCCSLAALPPCHRPRPRSPPAFTPEVAAAEFGETSKMTLLKSINDALDIVMQTDDTAGAPALPAASPANPPTSPPPTPSPPSPPF